MRAARSSSELKTTARPSFSNSLGSAAERFRIAPFGASDPNSATSPPCFDNGSENGLITARSTHAGRLSRTSFNETPATVMQSRSEEHTSELQSPCISYAVFFFKKKKNNIYISSSCTERD